MFGQLSADTKYLRDIPHYWPYMRRLGLPSFQYTAREVISGLCFTGYADDLSKTYSTLLAERVSAHLANNQGVDLHHLCWQTDNGSEFLENKQHRGLPSTVRAFGSDHRYIPPKAYTWQSDVETVHSLVEREFFDREDFLSPKDFWAKLTTYWLYFNIARPNSGKEGQTPLQIIRSLNPKISPAIASWHPLDLSALHNQYFHRYNPKRDHDLPVYPYEQIRRCRGKAFQRRMVAGVLRTGEAGLLVKGKALPGGTRESLQARQTGSSFQKPSQSA